MSDQALDRARAFLALDAFLTNFTAFHWVGFGHYDFCRVSVKQNPKDCCHASEHLNLGEDGPSLAAL